MGLFPVNEQTFFFAPSIDEEEEDELNKRALASAKASANAHLQAPGTMEPLREPRQLFANPTYETEKEGTQERLNAFGEKLSLKDEIDRGIVVTALTAVRAGAAFVHDVDTVVRWGVNTVCHSHPTTKKVCQVVAKGAKATGRFIAEKTPDRAKDKLREIGREFAQENEEVAADYELRLAIPIERTRQGYNDFTTVATAGAFVGTGHVLGKAIGKTVDFVRRKPPIEVTAPPQVLEPLAVKDFARVVAGRKMKVVESSSLVPEYQAGASFNPVFFAMENRWKTIHAFVIKQFGGYGLPHDRLARTRLAFEVLKGRTFEHISVPKMLACGPSSTKHCGYMATTFLKGEGFLVHFEKLRKLAIGSSERASYLEEIKLLFEKAGKGLAELHNLEITTGQSGTYIGKFWERLEILRLSAFKNLKSAGVELPSAITDPTPFLAALKRNPGSTTFTHGDAYVRNFVSSGGKVGIIDFETMGRSIGAGKKPIGLPATDTQQFLNSVAIFGKEFGLQLQERSVLKGIFEKAYHSVFQGIHTEEAKDFFRLYWLYYTMHQTKNKEALIDLAAECNNMFAPKKNLTDLVHAAIVSSKRPNLYLAIEDVADGLSVPVVKEPHHLIGESATPLKTEAKATIYSTSGKKVVIKKYYFLEGAINELMSLEQLRSLGLKNVVLPNPGKVAQSGDYFYLAREYTPGKTLMEILLEGAPFERNAAISQLGKAFGELHSLQRNTTPTRETLQSYSNLLSSVIKPTKESLFRLGLKLPKIDHRSLRDAWLKDPEPLGFTFNDAQLTNFVWGSKKLTFIDAEAHTFVLSPNKTPISFPAHEFYKSLAEIERNALTTGLSRMEIDALKETFTSSYRKLANPFTTDATTAYFEQAAKLQVIEDFAYHILSNPTKYDASLPILKELLSNIK